MNKKILIAVLVLLLISGTGILFFVNSDTEKTGGKDTVTKAEQSEEDAELDEEEREQAANEKENDKENEKEHDNSGLDVLEPDEVAAEDSSDAAGSWEDVSDSNTQTDNKNTTDKTDRAENEDSNEEEETDQAEKENPLEEEQTEQGEEEDPNETDKEDDEESEKEKDILEDDIIWGDIY